MTCNHTHTTILHAYLGGSWVKRILCLDCEWTNIAPATLPEAILV